MPYTVYLYSVRYMYTSFIYITSLYHSTPAIQKMFGNTLWVGPSLLINMMENPVIFGGEKVIWFWFF